jgi:hypothetical protein
VVIILHEERKGRNYNKNNVYINGKENDGRRQRMRWMDGLEKNFRNSVAGNWKKII